MYSATPESSYNPAMSNSRDAIEWRLTPKEIMEHSKFKQMQSDQMTDSEIVHRGFRITKDLQYRLYTVLDKNGKEVLGGRFTRIDRAMEQIDRYISEQEQTERIRQVGRDERERQEH